MLVNIVEWDERTEQKLSTFKEVLCNITRLATSTVALEYQLHADDWSSGVQKVEKG